MQFRFTTLIALAMLSFACAHSKPAEQQTAEKPAPAPAPVAKPAAVTSLAAAQAAAPVKAVLKEASIDLAEKIQFTAAKAEILPASEPVLNEVLGILSAHAEIDLVQVEGYTSNDGSAAVNKKLSQERADAVKDWLVKHGVDATRLASKGFGPESPIADNSTEDGREKNRRVDFKILKKH